MVLGLVGIGAGLTSALLFAVVITGSPLALLLSYIAPLPILIAALGWRHHAGQIGGLAGAVALGLALSPVTGVAFALGVALPAWWIAYLALLGQSGTDAAGRDTVRWYPIGNIILWVVICSALVTLAGGLTITTDYDSYTTTMRTALEAVLRGGGFGAGGLPQTMATPAELARILTSVVPYLAGASFVPMILGNLWLAASITRISGRLPRPWPDLASARLPRESAMLLLIAIAGCMVLSGFSGFAAAALTGALLAGFTLCGLAFIHDRTRGKPWRGAVLAVLYVGMLVLLPFAVLAMAMLVGLALIDSLFNLRGSPPSSSTPPL